MRLVHKLLVFVSIITLPINIGGFLFWHSATAQQTELLSSEISGNGQFVIFASPNKLVETDNNNLVDIYLRDTASNKIELISATSDGRSGNGESYFPSISSDGRYISFTSMASDLVVDDRNNAADIFTVDRQYRHLKIVTYGNNKFSVSQVANNGNIVFRSTESNATGSAGIFLYNRATASTKPIRQTESSLNQQGSLAISGSGQYVAYLASDKSVMQAFLFDDATGAASRVSIGENGVPANSAVNYVDVSNDGQYVVWSSRANNIYEKDTNNREDIFVYSSAAGKSMLVIESFAESGGDSVHPRISGDGAAIVFESRSDFTSGSGLTQHSMVYRLGLEDNIITRMSSNTAGESNRVPAEFPTISDDGLLVTFISGSDIMASDIQTGNRTSEVIKIPSNSPVEPLPISTEVATTGLFANLGILLILRPFLSSPNFLSGLQNGVSRFSDIWSSLGSYQLYYYGYFLNFLSLIGLRKKRKVWGTVYDSNNKQPLDPAVVELIDSKGKVIERAITDLAGRYGFIAVSGKYELRASKTHYVFPSVVHAGGKDEFYDNLYRGGELNIKDQTTLVNPNIPMDPVGFDWNQAAKQKLFAKSHGFLAKLEVISKMLFWLGFGFAVVNCFLHFNIWTALAVAVYIAILVFKLIAVEYRLWGKVFVQGRAPASPVRLELSEFQMGVVMGKALTAPDGKFFLKAPQAGKYKLTVKDEAGKKVLWEDNVVVGKNCVYNKNIKL